MATKVTNLVLLEAAALVAILFMFTYGLSVPWIGLVIVALFIILMMCVGFYYIERHVKYNNKHSILLQPVSDRVTNTIINSIVIILMLFILSIVALVCFHFKSVRLILSDMVIILTVSSYGLYFIKHNNQKNALVFGPLAIVILLFVLMSIPVFK